ncbi:NAD(P)-dependent oxidoreductase [Atlantibacter sp.]|uniref:NAD(P)-dependent oxidoreductase n=1 Tax=Atlantibacter sp. TaxID=1903473 RepID=UPI003917DE2C
MVLSALSSAATGRAAALGREGILINIARGSVVNEDALVNAIEQGTIVGALHPFRVP